ncbi:hypothetical protein EJB05_00672, partial [Eragrostis curvula]
LLRRSIPASSAYPVPAGDSWMIDPSLMPKHQIHRSSVSCSCGKERRRVIRRVGAPQEAVAPPGRIRGLRRSPPIRHGASAEGHLLGRCSCHLMAQQGCESCHRWQEHYYQEHMDVSRIRFFKLLTGDFAQGISIPEKFGNSLKGKVNKEFDLKAPSNETWRVSVTKHAGELFFMSGWGDFAKAHELQENDFLIFTLSGNYAFDVMIFDASGCEKVSSFFKGKRDPCMHKHFQNIAGQQAEHCILSDSDDTCTPLPLIESAYKASASKKMRGKTKPREEPESPDSRNYRIKSEAIGDEEQSDDMHADSIYYYSRSARILSGDEREEVLSLAPIQTGNPVFVTILQKTHMGHKNNLLIIPGDFAADHLETRSHDILLLRANRKDKWHVRYYHGRATRGFHCRRWIKFVQDNGLRKDFICIFELMKGAKRTTMVVHVVRKVNGRFIVAG